MTKNKYNIESILDSLKNNGYSNFINQESFKSVKKYLKKDEYKIYELYDDCNKVILYKKSIPKLSLLKVSSRESIRHQDIMGSIFSLGLKEDMFSDIIRFKNDFYVCVMPSIVDYLKYNMIEAGHKKIVIEEVFEYPEFKQEYKSIELIVSSLRIDNVVASITKSSRKDTLLYFKNKDIILNYEEAKSTRELHINDVFSIRKFGKYRFNGILKNTKKGGFIIEVLMYK